MQLLFHDPRVAIAYAICVAAPLVGWLVAIRITRVHHNARAGLRRRHQWVVAAYYLILIMLVLSELAWPPASWGLHWQVLSALRAALVGAGLWVGYSIFDGARKILRSDFSSACPGCGYSLQALGSKQCPECGHSLCRVSDRAG